MSLKSIFSGVSGILSLSPKSSRFRGVERKVTPSLGGDGRSGSSLGGVRMAEWKEELRFSSMSGDQVTGRRRRPESTRMFLIITIIAV